MNEVTRILDAVGRGEARAADRLLATVYEELRRLATAKLSRESSGHTLQPTALVHEAYLRLLGDEDSEWQNRAHFFAASAEAMRRILVERARRKARLKHGGDRRRVDMEDIELMTLPPGTDLIALDEALGRLESQDPQKAQLVKLRFFVGLSVEEAAKVLDISRATADRHWAYARAWLFNEVRKGDPGEEH